MSWEAIIDQMIEWVQAQGYLTTGFVDRGDPASFDFDFTSFIYDGAFHDLDLSGIIPSNAKAVLFSLRTTHTGVGQWGWFRKKGNANPWNVSATYSQVASVQLANDLVCPVGPDGKLEYLFFPGVIVPVYFTVKGWWL